MVKQANNKPVTDWHPDSHLFQLAVGHTINIEGGLSNKASDRGGLTKYGISQKQYPHLDIRALTKDEAIKIYWRDYWLLFGCPTLPDAAAIALFDAVVHHNGTDAVKMFQRAVRSSPDGIVGPNTIQQARRTDKHLMLAYFLAERGRLYCSIASQDPSQRTNIRGWMRRLFYLQQFILVGDFS